MLYQKNFFSRVGSAIGNIARNVLPAAAPILGTAFGGPVGGLIGGALGASFGGGASLGGGAGALATTRFPSSIGSPGPFGSNRLGVGGFLIPPGQPGGSTIPSHTPNLGVAPVQGGAITQFQGGSIWRGRFRMTRAQAIEVYNASGMVAPGFHLTDPKRSLYSVARNRRMNALNPRALSRAMRRARSFAKYASRVVSFTRHGAHGAKFKRGRRGRH